MHRTVLTNVLAALVAVALLPATAGAEKKPNPRLNPCVDRESNDVRLVRNGPPVDAPHLDMLSADLMSTRSLTTVVIRLRELREPAEGYWYATWRLGRTSYWAEARSDDLSGESAGAGVVGGAAIAARGKVDYAKNQVVVHVARGMTGKLASLAFTTRRAGDVENPVVVDDLVCIPRPARAARAAAVL